ncbi:hypothetical protein J7E62_12035 [Variovorax paradoxus]|nr:hypothetical protein [Variovorax paradoxus]
MPAERSMAFMNQCPAERFVVTPEPLPAKAPKQGPERAQPKAPPAQPTLF